MSINPTANVAEQILNTESTSRENQEELLKMLQRLWSIGKKHRDIWGDGWRRYWRLWMGQQYNLPAVGNDVKPVVNVTYQHIESLVALVNANQLRQILTSREENEALPTAKFQKWLDYVWDNANMAVKLPASTRELLITGN